MAMASCAASVPPEPVAGAASVAAEVAALAEMVGADWLGFFMTMEEEEAFRFVMLFHAGEAAGIAPVQAVLSPAADLFRRSVAMSPLPAIWGQQAERGSMIQRWSRSIAPAPGLAAGMALPVTGVRGRSGAAIFTNCGNLAPDVLLTVHQACYRLFAAAVALQPRKEGAPSMSARELECLQLTANGLTSDAIAAELGLSAHTANRYLVTGARKLDATSRLHAVAKALRAGLIE